MAHKKLSKQGFAKEHYLKAIIDGEEFVIAVGRVMHAVITEVLLEAATKYSGSFGSYDAHAVLQAIDDIEPSDCAKGDRECIQKFYSDEQFAYVFKLESDGSVSKQVLRLDLFRLIKPSEKHPGGYDFIGGLLHLLKHYRCNGYDLSTDPSSHTLSHPTDIIGVAIKCFFQFPHRYEPDNRNFTTLTDIDNEEFLCSFHETDEIEVYFLNSGYYPKKKSNSGGNISCVK